MRESCIRRATAWPFVARKTVAVVVFALGLTSAKPAARADVAFNFIFTDPANTGFNDPSLGPARQQALQETATALGALLNYSGRTVNMTANSAALPGSTLAQAGQSYVYPSGATGFRRGEVEDKIINGVDQRSTVEEGCVTVDFAKPVFLGSGSTPAGQNDFRSIILHELTHALGFASLINADGSSAIGSGIYSTFDSFLENQGGTKLVTSSGTFNTAGGASTSDLTAGRVFYNGTSTLAANGGARAEVFTPDPYQVGVSLSHLDPTAHSNAVMGPTLMTGTQRRTYAAYEAGMLRDIGYNVIPEPAALSLIGFGSLFLRRCRQIALA